jgi:hypothetical protein
MIVLQLTTQVNPSRKRIALNQTRLSKSDRTCESSVLATFTKTPKMSKCGSIIKYPIRIISGMMGVNC